MKNNRRNETVKQSTPLEERGELQTDESRDASRKELARLLSQVMKHPLLPTRIYDELGDRIVEETFDSDSPEAIELYLRAHELAEQRQQQKLNNLTE